jgi:radical SAM-linked protein
MQYRYRLKLTKLNELKFISHLDWQNLILKSLRRAGVKLALSEGFNPMPKVSYSPALPLFVESECELVNIITLEPLGDGFSEDFQKCIGKNAQLRAFHALPAAETRLESLETLVQWAHYKAKLLHKHIGIFNSKGLMYNVEKCLSDDVLYIKKINKKGIEKNINYRSSLHSAEVADDLIVFTLKAGQGAEIPSLRADEFIKAVFGDNACFEIKRTHFFDKNLQKL